MSKSPSLAETVLNSFKRGVDITPPKQYDIQVGEKEDEFESEDFECPEDLFDED